MSIRVILADDHAVVRDGIKAVVDSRGDEIEIVGEAANGKEVLALADNDPADVYVVDISMPILNGIETTERLWKKDPKCKIIILSMHNERSFLEKAMKLGAKGYILKESAIEEILEAIRQVHMDRFFLSPEISKHIVQGFLGNEKPKKKSNNKIGELTGREREILQLISEGFTTKDIARQLDLSVNTVHVHRNNIMRKLDIHKQAELIRYALKEGISHL